VPQPPSAPGLSFEIQTRRGGRFGERTVDTDAWVTVAAAPIATTADWVYRLEMSALGDAIRWRVAGIPMIAFSFFVDVFLHEGESRTGRTKDTCY